MKVIFEHQSNPSGAGFLVKEYIQTHFTSPYHFHDLYELILIKKSYGKLYAAKKIINFQDNDVYLFGPDFAHCFYNEKSFIEKGEKAHAIAIFFKKDFLGEGFFENAKYVKVNELLGKSTSGLHLTKTTPVIQELFSNITKQRGLDELITFLTLLSQISQLPQSSLGVINETQFVTKFTNKDSARLEPVINYVMENFREEVDSKTAAKLAHLSESAFCRYFKGRMEQTFSQFVNHVRVAHATNLLLTEEWDILRIYFESGFKNLSYFNRQFRHFTGQSPKEYRRSFYSKSENLVMDSRED
ncbi:AraC family transcriptional regulator [Chitinophaga defluvii]|uniref:AraC family transcriptional regulator n=1 Tax=Chitinophaga defluvii TaxID=3163343 RepID=A0ABV2TFZ3_9BACT